MEGVTVMEYIYGFIVGLILSNIMCYLFYINSINEVILNYDRSIKILRRMIDEYNR